MAGHKHIERCIAAYIARNYRNVAEIGIGTNVEPAQCLSRSGVKIFCTDIRPLPPVPGIKVIVDDIFAPLTDHYRGLDLIYSIRPHVEMLPPLISLAKEVDCDLLVYHLGFEGYGDGGDLIDCGVILHQYHRCQNPSKRVF